MLIPETLGWVQNFDGENQACINIIHLDSNIKVTLNQQVTVDTQIGTYATSQGHTHMAVTPGACNGTYSHSAELPVILNSRLCTFSGNYS